MVQFVQKRLQVFVSSTYTDLRMERQAAVEAILTAGHIPAGMELFTAGDESQMDVIKQWIDESDVYLLILGGRYGSLEPRTQKSYTHLEYDYALGKDKPLFSCVVTDSAQEARVKQQGTAVIETEHPQALKAFRDLVLTKTVRFWDDAKDIKIAIGETLAHLARRDDLSGWVRPHHEANMPRLADEIARLSKENAELRSQLEEGPVEPTIEGLEFEELLAHLKSQGLLEGLLASRPELGGIFFAPQLNELDRAQINELCILGLFQSDSPGRFRLSDSGHVFLNRLTVKMGGLAQGG